MNPETIALLAASVTVIGAVATAFMTFLRTKGSVATEVISNYKTLDEQNKRELEDWKDRTKKCEDLHRDAIDKMGQMKGQLDTTLSILKDRNPETTKFMEYITSVAQRSDTFMENSASREEKTLIALTEIGTFMKTINDHVNKGPTATTVNVTTPSTPSPTI